MHHAGSRVYFEPSNKAKGLPKMTMCPRNKYNEKVLKKYDLNEYTYTNMRRWVQMTF